ncbi:3-methyl-2-oxobutanoate hydroxymethyltransferase [Sulfurihydrogenibium azorense]|uniref:3-methyl-2-oxobutanoate hydroxymethyltransferase n=1 Tax=Sulfurihydrogenibium azorense (strain DSM 15241 / OCM 825 / Az-Fu1) TaxID=204536 RepID=C1DW72_SULAA|nr:3-methyl-2-oxobutanoate hydroxymethyltransferase [Sulfurihydrogenibium azorense]ACN99142.1 3-methyl-2-oxobutanoate hydroxymethyltransferase [Sulfurihydrogenibium azorense Az-Fu1]MDM7273948.1 3-methyl-2-oxobutanoate hydroxymethyltransferase [Sulfurihydrogenibium azorense]
MKDITQFLKAKETGQKITMVSTYDYWSAKLCEEAGIDAILVGDSLGMVIQGNNSTLPVSLEEMIYHTKAVRKGAPNTFIVVDMPFMSYHTSVEEAVKNAGRVIKETGANAVKLEGAGIVLEITKKLVSIGIPVMGHLGLTPQFINLFGGYKVQGKTIDSRKRILEDAKALEEAGVFSIVLEAVPSDLAKTITDSLKIPTIGIGAGKDTDGQILVFHDLIGVFEKTPKFVKRYLEAGKLIKQALSSYNQEVKDGKFPTEEYSY